MSQRTVLTISCMGKERQNTEVSEQAIEEYAMTA